MSLKKFIQDPDAVLDYTIDWSAWLPNGDTISSATATAPTGFHAANVTTTATTVTVWLSTGTAGSSYDVVIHIVTAGGREDDRTITIQVKEQ